MKLIIRYDSHSGGEKEIQRTMLTEKLSLWAQRKSQHSAPSSPHLPLPPGQEFHFDGPS